MVSRSQLCFAGRKGRKGREEWKIQVDEDLSRSGLGHIKHFDLGGYFAWLVVDAGFVLFGNLWRRGGRGVGRHSAFGWVCRSVIEVYGRKSGMREGKGCDGGEGRWRCSW